MFIQAVILNESEQPILVGINVSEAGAMLQEGTPVTINGVEWNTTTIIQFGKSTTIIGNLTEYLRMLGAANNLMYSTMLRAGIENKKA
jgi:hypothetical protein